MPISYKWFHNTKYCQMFQSEPISILFLTFPQAMWWVAQAMWSGLHRLCGGFCENKAKLSPT